MSALVRDTDPATSHEAAAGIVADGTRDRMQVVALECVRKTPGLTATELQAAHPAVSGAIWKRLNELEKLGLIRRGEARKSTVLGARSGVTWWPVENPQ